MRLAKVENGHAPEQQPLLERMRQMRGSVPPVTLTMAYRPELFGRPYAQLVQSVLRGPSDWSVGERELFAAFVSNLNQCRF